MEVFKTVRPFIKPLLERRLQRVINYNVRRVVLAHTIFGNRDSKVPLVLLHGFLGTRKNWRSISKLLSESLKTCVITLEARNHGESPYTSTHTYLDLAGDVKETLQKLSIPEAIIVGHSMGGRTGMALALSEAEAGSKSNVVNQLIVIDISPLSTPRMHNDRHTKVINAMKAVEFTETEVYKAKGEAAASLRAARIDEPTTNFLIMNVGKRKGGTIGWLYNIETLEEYNEVIGDFPKDLLRRKYESRTLFICGERSRYMPESDMEHIRRTFPNASRIVVPNAGHNVYAENPIDFIGVVENFIKKKRMRGTRQPWIYH